MSSETSLRSKTFKDMSQDSKSDPDRKSFNRKHNVPVKVLVSPVLPPILKNSGCCAAMFVESMAR